MRRICKYCGSGYDGDPGGSCCPDCAAKQRATSIRDRVCRQCGAIFPGGPRAWYCPICRAERQREAEKRHRQRGTARPIGSTDLCVVCGKPYIVNGSRQRYCPDCAPEAVRESNRANSRAWNREHQTPEGRRELKKAASAAVPCAVCGKLFVPNTAAITCSPDCARENRKRNQAAWEQAHKEDRNAYHRERKAKRSGHSAGKED